MVTVREGPRRLSIIERDQKAASRHHIEWPCSVGSPCVDAGSRDRIPAPSLPVGKIQFRQPSIDMYSCELSIAKSLGKGSATGRSAAVDARHRRDRLKTFVDVVPPRGGQIYVQTSVTDLWPDHRPRVPYQVDVHASPHRSADDIKHPLGQLLRGAQAVARVAAQSAPQISAPQQTNAQDTDRTCDSS